jgi:hypothetical protein
MNRYDDFYSFALSIIVLIFILTKQENIFLGNANDFFGDQVH